MPPLQDPLFGISTPLLEALRKAAFPFGQSGGFVEIDTPFAPA
jgi:hypothetical protein